MSEKVFDSRINEARLIRIERNRMCMFVLLVLLLPSAIPLTGSAGEYRLLAVTYNRQGMWLHNVTAHVVSFDPATGDRIPVCSAGPGLPDAFWAGPDGTVLLARHDASKSSPHGSSIRLTRSTRSATSESRLEALPERKGTDKVAITDIKISPDGNHISYLVHLKNTGTYPMLYIRPTGDEGSPRPLVRPRYRIHGAAWSPDSGMMAYVESPYMAGVDPLPEFPYRADPDVLAYHLCVADVVDGTTREIAPPWYRAEMSQSSAPSWSPGGTQIAYMATYDLSGRFSTDIYTIPLEGGQGPRRLTKSPEYMECAPIWSPSGDRVAFETVTVQDGVYDFSGFWTVRTDGTELQRWDLSGRNARELAWRPDGRAIAYKAVGGEPRCVVELLDIKMGETTSVYTGLTQGLAWVVVGATDRGEEGPEEQ
jgi:hypothetical protein